LQRKFEQQRWKKLKARPPLGPSRSALSWSIKGPPRSIAGRREGRSCDAGQLVAGVELEDTFTCTSRGSIRSPPGFWWGWRSTIDTLKDPQLVDTGNHRRHKARFLKPSPNPADNGELMGIDPRKIGTSDLRDLGHPKSYPKIIRAKCLD
jgi:hypothetical protein